MSLVSRLKAFEGKMKSRVRFQIEKVFHDAECGTASASTFSFQSPYTRYNPSPMPYDVSVPSQMFPGTCMQPIPGEAPSIQSQREESGIEASQTRRTFADVHNGKTYYPL